MQVRAEWIFGNPLRDYILHYENPQLDGPRILGLPLVLVPPEYTREESLVMLRMQRICVEESELGLIIDDMRKEVSKRKLACATMQVTCTSDANGDLHIEAKMIGRRLTEEFLQLERAYDEKFKPNDTECRVYLMKQTEVVALCLVLGLFFFWIFSRVQPVKVYDIVTYNCEYGLLEWRLRTLEHVVDVFVLVEGQETFQTGQDKDPCIPRKHPKVRHLYVPRSGKTRPWLRERFARQYALESFSELGITDSDIVISADVDEVPRPQVVQHFNSESATLDLEYCKYNLTNRLPNPYPHKATIARARHYKRAGIFRGSKTDTVIQNAGWHCSFCFMTQHEIQRKLEMYSHEQ